VPVATPIEQTPCACDELPCDCSYSNGLMSIGNVCPQGRILCEYGSGLELACLAESGAKSQAVGAAVAIAVTRVLSSVRAAQAPRAAQALRAA